MRLIINGCSLDLEQLSERDLAALIDNQTKRVELLANELQLLMTEQRRRSDLRMQRLNSVASATTEGARPGSLVVDTSV